MTGLRGRLAAAALLAGVALASLAGGAPGGVATADGDWTSFGRTPANDRHSPLTEITPANVSRLDRAYSVDFQKLDPDVRRGQQSYPLAIGGKLFVTTNDDNVFALDGATGKVLWQYKPPNSALFKNFGIVANRGLAYCDGRLFIAQLDMKLVALRPGDGKVLGVVSVSHDVWNASTNYGYSETSAPICANHRVLVGAAGSEYGIRGFVMAYTTDLRPAWPSPFWTIPPDLQSWRRTSRVVGGGVGLDARYCRLRRRTPSTSALDRRRRCTSRRCGPAQTPRTDALVAVDLRDRAPEVVAAADRRQPVGLRRLAAAARLPGEGREARSHDVVSVATMEGVWFAFDAKTGSPFHERVKVIDRVEHPPLPPGRARDRLPVLARRPELLARLRTIPQPTTSSTPLPRRPRVLVQQKLTPTQKRRKLLLGDVYLGLQNGNFGGALAGLARPRLDQRDRRLERQARLEVPDAGARARRRDHHRERARLRGGRRRRAARLRSSKRARCSGRSRPAIRSRPGRRSSAAGGREYVAVTVGRHAHVVQWRDCLATLRLHARDGHDREDDAECPARGGLARDWRRARLPHRTLVGDRWRRSDHRQRRRRPARALASRQLERSHRRRGASVCEASLSLAPSSRSTATGCPGGPTPRVASPCSWTRRSPVGTRSMSPPPPMQPWAGAR